MAAVIDSARASSAAVQGEARLEDGEDVARPLGDELVQADGSPRSSSDGRRWARPRSPTDLNTCAGWLFGAHDDHGDEAAGAHVRAISPVVPPGRWPPRRRAGTAPTPGWSRAVARRPSRRGARAAAGAPAPGGLQRGPLRAAEMVLDPGHGRRRTARPRRLRPTVMAQGQGPHAAARGSAPTARPSVAISCRRSLRGHAGPCARTSPRRHVA